MEGKRIEFEAEFLSVLAQPTRLKILYFLKDGEKCACEINPQMREDASVISRHLVRMKSAGILESRREGVSTFYKIKDSRVFDILQMVDDILISAFKAKSREMAEEQY